MRFPSDTRCAEREAPEMPKKKAPKKTAKKK